VARGGIGGGGEDGGGKGGEAPARPHSNFADATVPGGEQRTARRVSRNELFGAFCYRHSSVDLSVNLSFTVAVVFIGPPVSSHYRLPYSFTVFVS